MEGHELHLFVMDIAISKAGVPIRLTDERWHHIVENHDDLAGYYDDVWLPWRIRILFYAVTVGRSWRFDLWVEGNS
jgi:hypothetical protein